jgi:hypothetical protein
MALLVPEYLQTQKYSAKRDRLTLAHGGPVQAGVWAAGDFLVTQRALGANMTVDVSAGSALVAANDPGNAGLYHVVNDAPLLGTSAAAAHATLPRIDSVYVQVLDSTDGGDSSDAIQIICATGTATSGATLDNRSGAPTIPTGALLLADILVPAASTSVTTANIRDRRAWARGFFNAIFRNGADVTTSGPINDVASDLFLPIEVGTSGIVRVTARSAAYATSGTNPTSFPFRLRMTTRAATPVNVYSAQNEVLTGRAANVAALFTYSWTFTGLAPGPYIAAPQFAGNGVVVCALAANSTSPFQIEAEEIVRQVASNT